MVLGVVYSILVSVLFSAFAIPRKFTKQNSLAYTIWVGMAFFITTALFYFVMSISGLGYNENLFSVWHLMSAGQGILWAVGSACVFSAVDKIGLSKSTQWKNLQGPIAAVLMLIFLSDVVGLKILFVVGGTLAMFISALLFSIQNKQQSKKQSVGAVLLSLAGALCYGLCAFSQKMLTNQGFVFSPVVYFSLFVFITATIIYAIKHKNIKSAFVPTEPLLINPFKKEYSAESHDLPMQKQKLSVFKQMLPPIIVGVVYSAAAILNMLAYKEIAGSVAFSIIQLNTVWTILAGILIFKEINFKQNVLRITLGFVFAIGAIALLVFAL